MLPFVIRDEVVNQKMQIQSLFPTSVGILQMDKAVSKKILAFMKSKGMRMELNISNNTSIDRFVLDNDELSDIKKVLTDSVNEYFKEIVNSDQGVELYITNSWINVTKNGESHQLHKHKNSILSAILYIDTCEEDKVSFITEHDVFGNFSFTSNRITDWNANLWTIQAETDKLVMFPSTLSHRVNTRPNTCTGTRISLSFNTWVEGMFSPPQTWRNKLH
jgi:uncharacterized protein (TIGR02466 family)